MMKRAVWNGQTIAESENAKVTEGVTYFPDEDVKREFLRPSSTTSTDASKGQARFYNLMVNNAENLDAAYYYPNPSPAARSLKHHVAFWRDIDITE